MEGRKDKGMRELRMLAHPSYLADVLSLGYLSKNEKRAQWRRRLQACH